MANRMRSIGVIALGSIFVLSSFTTSSPADPSSNDEISPNSDQIVTPIGWQLIALGISPEALKSAGVTPAQVSELCEAVDEARANPDNGRVPSALVATTSANQERQAVLAFLPSESRAAYASAERATRRGLPAEFGPALDQGISAMRLAIALRAEARATRLGRELAETDLHILHRARALAQPDTLSAQDKASVDQIFMSATAE